MEHENVGLLFVVAYFLVIPVFINMLLIFTFFTYIYINIKCDHPSYLFSMPTVTSGYLNVNRLVLLLYLSKLKFRGLPKEASSLRQSRF